MSPVDQNEPSQILILFVSVSKIACPVTGEFGRVEDVQTVMSGLDAEIFAAETEPLASFVSVIAESANFAVATALLWMDAAVIDESPKFCGAIETVHLPPE